MAADQGNAGSRTSRLDRHRAVADALAGLDDDELAARVDAATPLGVGIGGRTARLDVAGVPVFVKRIPLTDPERRPGHLGSTANVFGLPTFYQYGVGSTGFGAWRELATHHTTTQWVRSGVSARFPLLHHWRVLPSQPAALPDFGDWDSDPAVARRLAAIEAATAGVVLFLEFLPWTLHAWLTERFDAGDGERATAFADRELRAATEVTRAHGLVHFDAHPGNVLTDGHRVYLADFGLALDRAFDLSPAEAAFLDLHCDWDRWDTRRYLVNWLCGRLAPHAGRTSVIRAGGSGLPAYARAVITRYAPTALLLNDFYDRLVAGPKTTPYPARELLTAGRERTPAVSPPRR
ncbi:serine/threonine protein phosphatase [Actinoplanes sp. NPDC048967]|uniref:serine/threonine protein phosphatase n=1 Tax=Actinoplanes sp. NPDC048967 TaxID=3155269 RepID=UPI0034102CFB